MSLSKCWWHTGDLTVVLERQVLAVIDSSTLHVLDTFSNFRDQTLLGMVFSTTNQTRTIAGHADGIIVLDTPLPRFALSPGAPYTVLSEWRPPVTDLVCQVLHCEAFETPVGAYLPTDVHVLPSQSRPRYGEEITVQCKPGYYVVGDMHVNVSNVSMPNQTAYTATCTRCRYLSDRHCAIAECYPHVLRNSTESGFEPAVLVFGESVTVHCKYGYRAAPAGAGAGCDL